MDSDEHRRMLALTRNPPSTGQEGDTTAPNSPLHNSGPVVPRWKDDEGPDKMP